jgi:hypothetical protein
MPAIFITKKGATMPDEKTIKQKIFESASNITQYIAPIPIPTKDERVKNMRKDGIPEDVILQALNYAHQYHFKPPDDWLGLLRKTLQYTAQISEAAIHARVRDPIGVELHFLAGIPTCVSVAVGILKDPTDQETHNKKADCDVSILSFGFELEKEAARVLAARVYAYLIFKAGAFGLNKEYK